MTFFSQCIRKDGGSQRRHVRGAAMLLLFSVLLLLCATTVASVKMELVMYGSTEAGVARTPGTVDGGLTASRLTNPQGLCYSHNASDTASEEFLLGDLSTFRIFDRAAATLSTWFPARLSSNVDGPLFATAGSSETLASVATPTSCNKFVYPNNSAVVTFFVTGSNQIRYIVNNYVYSYSYADTTIVFSAVTTFQTSAGTATLYAVSSGNVVVSCAINGNLPVIYSCSPITISGTPTSTGTNKGILAASDYFIFTAGSALVKYSLSGTLQASVSGTFIDVKRGLDNVVYAATTSAVYIVTVGATSLSATLYAGTQNDGCNINTNNVDGANPTFCGIVNLLPFSASEIYVSVPQVYVLRAVTLPPVQVPIFFGRTPFPIGFVNASDIMPTLIADITRAIFNNVNADNVSLQNSYPPTLNSSSGAVNDATWDTDYTVLVPQQAFDNETTVAQIWGADYNATLTALEAYYNQTDEVYYGDNSTLPVCNRTKELLVEREVAAYARRRLNYSLIYTNKTFETHAANVSGIKLLMPTPFGNLAPYGDNATTHALLNPSESEVNRMLLQAVRDSYPASAKYNLSFSQETYHFAQLNAAQTSAARWWVQNHVMQRVRECAAAAGNPAGNGTTMTVGYPAGTDANAVSVTGIGGGNGPELTCVPIVGISNQTVTAGVGSTYNDYNYELFLPEGYNFTGTEFASCMNSTDWSGLVHWLDGQPQKKKKGCDTGCIVGVAVASAAVACVLIAVIVVLTSKRRRLATVVAPPAGGAAAKPRFAGTVDLDEENSTSNPLMA